MKFILGAVPENVKDASMAIINQAPGAYFNPVDGTQYTINTDGAKTITYENPIKKAERAGIDPKVIVEASWHGLHGNKNPSWVIREILQRRIDRRGFLK